MYTIDQYCELPRSAALCGVLKAQGPGPQLAQFSWRLPYLSPHSKNRSAKDEHKKLSERESQLCHIFNPIGTHRDAANRSISTTISQTAKERNMSQAVNTTVTILRRVQVQARTGLSRSSIYKMMQENEFPRQVALGRRTIGWRSDDIDQWLESRPVKS